MKETKAELPEHYLPLIAGIINVRGLTLGKRTRERNWVLLRLANMYNTAKSWHMIGVADQVKAKMHEVKVSQKVDTELTDWYRRQVDNDAPLMPGALYTKRHQLTSYWNYKLSRPETTND